MQSGQAYADADTAKRIAHELYPNAQSITMIEHSYDNIVALVDNTYAIRFPRDENAGARSRYEKHVLQHLETVADITIPQILGSHSNPVYLVTSFVPGQHISTQAIRTLSQGLQIEFAEKVAQFAYSMHSAFNLKHELKMRQELGLDALAEEPWAVYFRKTISEAAFPTPQQEAIAKEYYAKWDATCNVSPQNVVHDDLHTENMLFDADNHLIGILDFGDTNIGTPEQDLRQLYRINEDVLATAIRTYENLSGKKLDIKLAKTWAITQELAVYSEQLANGKTDHRTFKRACRNLNAWLGDGDWGKGFDISDIDGYQ